MNKLFPISFLCIWALKVVDAASSVQSSSLVTVYRGTPYYGYTVQCKTQNIPHTRSSLVTSGFSTEKRPTVTASSHQTFHKKTYTDYDNVQIIHSPGNTVTVTKTPASATTTVTSIISQTDAVTRTEVVFTTLPKTTVTPTQTVEAPLPTGFVDIYNSTGWDNPDVLCSTWDQTLWGAYTQTYYYLVSSRFYTETFDNGKTATTRVTAPSAATASYTVFTTSTSTQTVTETITSSVQSTVTAKKTATATAYDNFCSGHDDLVPLADVMVDVLLPADSYDIVATSLGGYVIDVNTTTTACCSICAGTPGCAFGYLTAIIDVYEPECQLYVLKTGTCTAGGQLFAGRMNETMDGSQFYNYFNGPCGKLTF